MNLTVVSPPPFEPVTLEEVYRHLRLTPSGSPPSHPDDALLSGNISAARAQIEHDAQISLVEQTLRLSARSFPRSENVGWHRHKVVDGLQLTRPPFIRVVSVSYYDADNVLQLVDPSSYYVTDEQVPRLCFVSTFAPPAVYNRQDAVRVIYEAGYAPEGSPPTTQEEYAANIPRQLKDAVLLGVQLLYDDLAPADRTALELAKASLINTCAIKVLA